MIKDFECLDPDMAIAMVPTNQPPPKKKNGHNFCSVSNGLDHSKTEQNGGHFVNNLIAIQNPNRHLPIKL